MNMRNSRYYHYDHKLDNFKQSGRLKHCFAFLIFFQEDLLCKWQNNDFIVSVYFMSIRRARPQTWNKSVVLL